MLNYCELNRKDLNYIAKLERAIKQKYGTEAIQNPASQWDEQKEKEYIEKRIAKGIPTIVRTEGSGFLGKSIIFTN